MIKQTCAGPLDEKVYSAKEAKALGNPAMKGHRKRKGCGQNLTDLIAKIPADGNEHKLKCPKCGNIAKVEKTPPEETTEEA
jgi:hypothetical protein